MPSLSSRRLRLYHEPCNDHRNQRPLEGINLGALRGKSKVIMSHSGGNQLVIRSHQESSGVIRSHQESSGVTQGAIRCHQESSGVIRSHQEPLRGQSVGHQESSGVIRSHQESSGVTQGAIRCHQESHLTFESRRPTSYLGDRRATASDMRISLHSSKRNG
jgi:hypothetical protein